MIILTKPINPLKTLFILTAFSLQVHAEELARSIINISQLGNFKADFTQVRQAKGVETEKILGKVTFKPKSSFKVLLPFSPQRISFLSLPGSTVRKGQKIARIEGPEVHHFLDELAASKTIYLKSKKHLEAIKNYANSNTIKSTEWLGINKAYLEAKLDFEHLSHVLEQLKIESEQDIFLISPSNGLLDYSVEPTSYLYEIIPAQSVLVESFVLAKIAGNIKILKSEDNCLLQVKAIDETIQHHKQLIWSTPSSGCALKPGQQILLRPTLSIEGLEIPQRALFELHDKSYVAVKQNEQLSLVEVTIIGKEKLNYIVKSEVLSEDNKVLVSFVNIAQGIFLGLGE